MSGREEGREWRDGEIKGEVVVVVDGGWEGEPIH